MVTIASLALPIIVSAVFVFLASAIIHMVLPYHKDDFTGVPDEEGVLNALRAAGATPGDYVLPYASAKDRKSPAFQEKVKRGPVAFLTILPSGQPAMGKSLALWFVLCLVVSIFAAYVAGRALAPGADYLAVFRFSGATAFAGYALSYWQNSIWYGRRWSTSLKTNIDALIYAVLTAGTFGWLWPA